MYVLVVFLPLLSFFIAGSLGFFLGRMGGTFLSVVSLGVSFFLSLWIFYEVVINQAWVHFILFDWAVLDFFSVSFGLLFDNVTAIMLLIITGISFFVHLYSLEYMSHDPHLNRFISYLSLFTFFMLMLVTADNFLQLFIGWEGVGLCSYLLINFWFTRILANKAALKAMIMNRVADVFFIIAIILFLAYFGSTDYQVIFSLLASYSNHIYWFFGLNLSFIDVTAFFLFCGAIGKSAQLGLHTWLPDAMEGPTPVSALLHAATMVTAGVFLIVRSAPVFEYSPLCLFLVALAGGFTAFFFSFCAVFQFDVKKIIAYSTCSQLGYMFLCCGLSFYNVGLFHLFNHAFFKALLFLSAGAIIHALNDEQDIRRMGGLVNFLPFTFFAMLFGSLAIMGFPFLTGFFSKDLVLELLLSSYKVDFTFFYCLALVAAFFTAVYSIRLLLLVFFFKPKFYFVSYPVESEGYVFTSLFCLTICSLVFGYLFADLFVGWGSYVWFFSFPANVFPLDVILLSPLQRNLPLIFSFCGWFLGIIFIYFIKTLPFRSTMQDGFLRALYILSVKEELSVSSFLYFSGFFNTIYNRIFISLYVLSYNINTKLLDKGLLEMLGPIGLYKLFYSMSRAVWNTSSSLFLNIGFMVFALLALYIYSIVYTYMFIFYVIHYGMLSLTLLILYNEFN